MSDKLKVISHKGTQALKTHTYIPVTNARSFNKRGDIQRLSIKYKKPPLGRQKWVEHTENNL